ncbi:MAG: propionyl-CoA carboxylase subunit beta [Gammaproteobacteria bacterium]|nr:MAG: propionyl-CoA carboxylase subunit beta [Gammaproteobacteria bacterium]|tara:strand:+ start:4734 stop:6287 length:1554 start_codon:yes stop_codon:yes gene_type:complete
MSWENEVKELERRRHLAKQQGGKEGIAKQHAKGRLTIRERIDTLLDPNSFREHGQATASPVYDDHDEILEYAPANYIVGFGKIDQRRIVVGGEDFTLKGGSPNAAGLRKSVYAEHLAVQYKVPLIRMLEGGGGSVKGSAKKGGTVGEPVFTEPRFKIIADAMSEVPVVSGAMGAVAGFPAGRLVASHFSVMTKHTAQVLIGGPALVERALGVSLTKDELGGAQVHASSGVIDNLAEDEHDAFAQIKKFLSFLPSSVHERTPRYECHDSVDRMEQDLLTAVPRDSNAGFDMRAIVEMIVDQESFFEMGKDFGPSQICGLAQLNGQPVGILANDCMVYAGAMTAEAAQKYRRFVEMCDTFHVPIVNFVDQPGFMIGPESEAQGTIRYGMAAVCAASQSTIPWAVIQVHKGFGVATAAHYAPGNYVLAWPSVESGALPLEGGVAVAFHREIAAAENPEAKRRELEERIREARSPFPRAESFAVHELIDPRETRPMLCEWIDWIQPQLDNLVGPVRFGMRP